MVKKLTKLFKDMDKVLLFTTILLIIFGTLNIVTASSREAVVTANTNLFYYFYKHVIILIVSFVSFLVVINIPTKNYKNWLPILYIAVFVLNAYLVLKGAATRGANNWVNLKLFKLQPSEFAKPVLILTAAVFFEMFYKRLKDPKIRHDLMIWRIIGFCVVLPALVFLQKDLGTCVILLMIFIVMFIFSPISTKEKIKSSIISVVLLAILLIVRLSITGYILSDVQESRINNFFNPCSKYETTGYQICNAFIAINKGGLTGVGIGKSTQKYSYIPEPHTDMVFAIIAEEYGTIICVFILFIYMIILYRILALSSKTKSIRNKYICVGVSVYIFMHIFINLGGLFGLIPLTGVPLPFLSYGGSFLLTLITTLGMIQRIHIEYKNEKIVIK